MSKITRLVSAAVLLFGLCGCASVPISAALPEQASASSKKESKVMDSHPGPTDSKSASSTREVATFGGGCFWCTEAVFQELKGVEKVVPGYAGGHVQNPTYEQVCTGQTGHAESIQITFDPKVISFADLLHIFLTTHDPTTLNRQGADVGTQYRSAIFYHSEAQKKASLDVIAEMEKKRVWPGKIVTEVTAFTNFYPAEEYHREYYERNPDQPYCRIVIAPKVAKLREKYRDMLKR